MRIALFCLIAIFLAGCSQLKNHWQADSLLPENPVIDKTFATPSPTAQLTATPTAIAIEIASEYLPFQPDEALAGSQARCEIVDTFDFPLDPPNGGMTSGGLDFGVFRARFDGYHTGEDFFYRDRSNFGAPVFSIGNGVVTYADPEGWGRDKGTVIIQHSLPDGGHVYSFYGHLDPPSVILAVGTCIERGDIVGRIGQPRTPPHLHFEIRKHWPDRAGPGYWPVDPQQGGWISPTEFIESFRFEYAPHVEWSQSMRASSTQFIGLLESETLLLYENQNLVGFHLQDGEIPFNHRLPFLATDSWFDPDGEILYTSNFAGRLKALSASEAELSTSPEPLDELWVIDQDRFGMSEIMPLPQDGVVLVTNGIFTGISGNGQILWEEDVEAEPMSWALFDDQLIVSTKGATKDLWTIDHSGMTPWRVFINGTLKTSGDHLYLHHESGISLLNRELKSAEMITTLPHGSPEDGDLLPLASGKILLMHPGRIDQRIILIGEGEGIVWDRSYQRLEFQNPRLFLRGDIPYVAVEEVEPAYGEIGVYQIDTESAVLNEVFRAGVHAPVSSDSEILVQEDGLLIFLFGRRLLSVDLQDQ